MDIVSREELRALMEDQHDNCVSIFLPTHRSGAEIQQDSIRLKNLLRKCEEQLSERGMRSTDIQELLAPAQALLGDSLFWHYQSDGLAIFLSPAIFRFFRVPIRFDEMCLVARGFQLKRLLHLLANDASYYILALSKKNVHLYLGTHHTVSEVDIDTIPHSLAEALKYDEYEKHIQFRSQPMMSNRVAARGGGRGMAVYYGQGGSEDQSKTNLLRYFQQIDRGLTEFLGNSHAPLVIAGVDYLLPIYREANSYPLLLPEGVIGSPERMSTEELHKRSWGIVQPFVLQKQREAADRYNNLRNTDRVSNDIRHILPAAIQGRVETLFVGTGLRYWGTYNPGTFEVTLHKDYQPGDEDLLNEAALYTLLNKGTVFAVEGTAVPDDLPVAGVLRY